MCGDTIDCLPMNCLLVGNSEVGNLWGINQQDCLPWLWKLIFTCFEPYMANITDSSTPLQSPIIIIKTIIKSQTNKSSSSYLLEWPSVIAIIITLINNLPPWGKDVIYGRGFDKKKFIRAKQYFFFIWKLFLLSSVKPQLCCLIDQRFCMWSMQSLLQDSQRPQKAHASAR